MKFEKLFDFKPVDEDLDDQILIVVSKLLGTLPCDEKGNPDWHEAGAMLGDKVTQYVRGAGASVGNDDEARTVLYGAVLSACAALWRNRDKYLNSKKVRELNMLAGFLEASGMTSKVAGFLIKNGFGG